MKAALISLLFSTLILCNYQFDHLQFREFTDADELPRFVYTTTTTTTSTYENHIEMGGQTQKVIKLQ